MDEDKFRQQLIKPYYAISSDPELAIAHSDRARVTVVQTNTNTNVIDDCRW